MWAGYRKCATYSGVNIGFVGLVVVAMAAGDDIVPNSGSVQMIHDNRSKPLEGMD
jgi:hypothetical protein